MNALYNQKLEIWCIVIKSLYMNLIQYMARLQDINNYRPMLPGSNALNENTYWNQNIHTSRDIDFIQMLLCSRSELTGAQRFSH